MNSVNASGIRGGSGGYYPPDDLSHSEILDEGGRGKIIMFVHFFGYLLLLDYIYIYLSALISYKNTSSSENHRYGYGRMIFIK